MPILVRACGVAVLPANGLAVLGCAAVNFAGADRLVFGREPVSEEGLCTSDSPPHSERIGES
jgi:hypothetical protein